MLFFKKKGWLRKQFDAQFVQSLKEARERWLMEKDVVARSTEPSDEVIHQLRVTEAKYLFLLREAKVRKINSLMLNQPK